jgi:amino acid adenylation domain-containing protein
LHFEFAGLPVILKGAEMNSMIEASALATAGPSGNCERPYVTSTTKKTVPQSHSATPPLYRGRPDHYCAKSASVSLEVGANLCDLLLKVTKNEPLLHYAALAAAASACLYRYTQSSPISLGSPAIKGEDWGSSSDDLAIVAIDVDGSTSFRQFLLNVRQALLVTQQQRYALPAILEEADKLAIRNRCPFFDVALIIAGLHPAMPEARHDITLTFSTQPEQALFQANFSPDLYEPETIRRFCCHILRILQSGLENTNGLISHMEILDKEEKNLLATLRNDTAAGYPRDRCMHQLFEEHAAHSPNNTALVYGSQRLTYGELNERANQTAHYLLSMGMAPDTPVGVFLNRSVEQVVAVLGILKAGAAYVPYDPTYPKNRLAAMFEDLKVKAVLTSERLINRLPDTGVRRICLDGEAEKIKQESTKNPNVRPAAFHLCYIIFTSGSTGRAKAAAVYHGGWMNLLSWFARRFDITPSDKTLVMSSISFDITQRAMAMPLTSGGELHLVASDHYDPKLILDTINAEKITLMNCAPSTFYPLVEGQEVDNGYAHLRSLRWLFLGGEAISASRLKNWSTAEDCKTGIANVYGAAECSDVSSYYVLRDLDRYISSSVPIGKHIHNTQIYLLDDNLQLVPSGVIGEICLAGDGVGKGYINDETLTARKFPSNPFAKDQSARIYRTGDLARYLPDGNLEFMGRVDNQIKIRGQRVELGEIETVLRQQAGVREAVVVQSQVSADFKRLVAYIVPEQAQTKCEQDQLIDKLRVTLTSKLPQYMVPNAFVVLVEMPLNPNGKVDRGALPQPALARGSGVSDPPRTDTEKVLADMFAKLLGAEEISVSDNFFSLGGHSLLVTQALANIGTAFNMEFPAVNFYKEPTVAAIATHIDATLKAEFALQAGTS